MEWNEHPILASESIEILAQEALEASEANFTIPHKWSEIDDVRKKRWRGIVTAVLKKAISMQGLTT